eukprot:12478626-Ditylum_brightwellii.AAC.2
MRTKQGYGTLLNVAIGEKVDVNTILGVSVINAAKLSLDLSDDVVDPRVFGCAMFALKYKHAARFLLNLGSGNHKAGNMMYHENAIVSQDTISACWVQ